MRKAASTFTSALTGAACLDTKTGAQAVGAARSTLQPLAGPAAWPILYRDLLILTFDGCDHCTMLVALNLKTGQTVWRSDPRTRLQLWRQGRQPSQAFGTPSVITVPGKPELVGPAAIATTAFNPLTGQVLWTVHHGGMNVTQPPLFGFGKVILCSGDGGLKMLAVRPEGAGDVNQDEHRLELPQECAVAVVADLGGRSALFRQRSRDPIVHRRQERGFHLATAAGRFVSGRPRFCADGRLLSFCNNKGTSTVGQEQSETWKKLATNKLDDGCMASPAMAGKALFIRTKTHLYRMRTRTTEITQIMQLLPLHIYYSFYWCDSWLEMGDDGMSVARRDRRVAGPHDESRLHSRFRRCVEFRGDVTQKERIAENVGNCISAGAIWRWLTTWLRDQWSYRNQQWNEGSRPPASV